MKLNRRGRKINRYRVTKRFHMFIAMVICAVLVIGLVTLAFAQNDEITDELTVDTTAEVELVENPVVTRPDGQTIQEGQSFAVELAGYVAGAEVMLPVGLEYDSVRNQTAGEDNPRLHYDGQARKLIIHSKEDHASEVVVLTATAAGEFSLQLHALYSGATSSPLHVQVQTAVDHTQEENEQVPEDSSPQQPGEEAEMAHLRLAEPGEPIRQADSFVITVSGLQSTAWLSLPQGIEFSEVENESATLDYDENERLITVQADETIVLRAEQSGEYALQLNDAAGTAISSVLAITVEQLGGDNVTEGFYASFDNLDITGESSTFTAGYKNARENSRALAVKEEFNENGTDKKIEIRIENGFGLDRAPGLIAKNGKKDHWVFDSTPPELDPGCCVGTRCRSG